MIDYSNARYLAAKRTVDDRALNKDVLARLRAEVAKLESRAESLRVVEVGAGLGNMVARLVDWGVLRRADYQLVDVDGDALALARDGLTAWAGARGHHGTAGGHGLQIRGQGGVDLVVRMTVAEIGDFVDAPAPERGGGVVDLLIAHAVLDLIDLPVLLPKLLRVLSAPGLFWFTINYDGDTIFQPEHAADEEMVRAYHGTMDGRIRHGKRAGESRTGRHLFGALRAAGAEILVAGASDWVVHPSPSGYAADEAYFLHHIVNTIDEALRSRPEIDGARRAAWVNLRHAQVESRELVYVAHQLDFLGHGAGSI